MSIPICSYLQFCVVTNHDEPGTMNHTDHSCPWQDSYDISVAKLAKDAGVSMVSPDLITHDSSICRSKW